jgi:outer membrane protein insertion porin family
VTLTANLGNVDDYIRPTSGFLIRPQLEMGGQLVRMQDDVEYFKSRLELVGYLPITEEFNLTGRLYAGRIWPTGSSRNQAPDDSISGVQTEFRFDRIRFYGGGANDVRGWPNTLLGSKFAYRRVDPTDTLRVDYAFEPNGGLGKLAANVELRTPLPFFGPAWRGAVFVDMGQVFPTAENDSLLFDKERVSSVGFDLRDLRIGVGGGLRYQTLVGYIRLDLAYKVNPTIEDLASPEEIWRLQRLEIDRSDIETNWRDRFRLHLSIGQSF